MKSLLFLLALLAPGVAHAQSTTRPQAVVVTACGTAPNSGYATVGSQQNEVMDVNGSKCVSGGTTIADGGSVTLGAKADAKSTATDTTPITIMSVLKQVSASIQAAAASLAGTLTVSGTVTTTPPANASTNVAQVNAVTASTGQGASGTGTLRVTSNTNPDLRTLVTLDVKTVTTGGTAVTAIAAGNRTAGGFLSNPKAATIDLCINEIGTAVGTVSSGDTTCILPGQTYTVAPASTGVSVISSDSAHPYSGYGVK